MDSATIRKLIGQCIVLVFLIAFLVWAYLYLTTNDASRKSNTTTPNASASPSSQDTACSEYLGKEKSGTVYTVEEYQSDATGVGTDTRICKFDLAANTHNTLIASTFELNNKQRPLTAYQFDTSGLQSTKALQISSELYLQDYNPTRNGGGYNLFRYDLSTQKVSKLTISRYTSADSGLEVKSPDGKFIVTTDQAKQNKALLLLDLAKDTTQIIDETSGDNAFYLNASVCSQGDIKWSGNNTIEYHIYNLKDVKTTCEEYNNDFDIASRIVETKTYTIK